MFREAGDVGIKPKVSSVNVPAHVQAEPHYQDYRRLLADATNNDFATLEGFDKAYLEMSEISEILFEALSGSDTGLFLELYVPDDAEENYEFLHRILMPFGATDVLDRQRSALEKDYSEIGDWMIALNPYLFENDIHIYQIEYDEHASIALRPSVVDADREGRNLLKLANIVLLEPEEYW